MKKFNYIYICLILLLGFISNNIFAQQVNFSPRTSPQAPVPYKGVQNYNLQGDFVMLGNANLNFTETSRRNDNTSNNQSFGMSYIDIDGDNTTVNSSSSELKLGDIDPNCSEIIYAGLYWSGKADNTNNTSILSTGTSNSRTNGNSFNGYSLSITAGDYSAGSGTSNGTLGTYTFSGGGVNTIFRFRSWRTGTSGSNYTGTVTVQIGSGPESATLSGTISNDDPFVFTFDEPYMINTGSQTIYISAISKRRNNTSINTNYNATIVSGAKLLDKRKVKFKKEGQSYDDIWADDNKTEIYYPGSDQSGIYAGYADVTDYVRQHGVGNYFVADMALTEGLTSTGYFGGWGMVVIYKNSAMKWRDITVFDGYAYIGLNSTQTFDISGFKAVQDGAVNIKMGIMAGEGDKGSSGDYIEIRNRNDNNSYTRLSHGGNSTNNFFNASIFTGSNNRSPNYSNNAGMDISMFDLPNGGSSNTIINNNQTSTRFRYGSTGDLYSIYNVVFAVDAYVPEVVGENSPASAGTVHNSTVIPGQDLDFDLKIYNKGEEAVNNTKVEIPIPFNMHYSPTATIHPNMGGLSIPINTTVNWVPPVGAPSGATPQNTPGGKLVWTIGTLPEDDTKSILLGILKYKLKVTENCALLATAGPCGLKVKINGKITGVGATSTTSVSSDLVRDYGAAACAGPVYDDFESTIAVSQSFIQNCTPPPVENGMLQFVAFCSLPGNEFPRAQITGEYPWGTKFFTSQPANYDQTTDIVTGNFSVNTDGTKTTYWAVVPGMDPGCFIRLQTSLTLVTTSPTAQNVAFCAADTVTLNVARSATGVANNYQLFYYASNGTTLLASAPTTAGTYWVAEGVNQNGVICTGNKVQFTVTVNPLPTVQKNVPNVSICENNNTQFTVTASTASGAVTYQWQYASVSAPAVWNTLNNTTYNGQITVNNGSLNITNAVRIGVNSINGMKVRLKVINTNGCEEFSNEVVIQIKDCRAITNPMLPNKAKKQS